MRTLETIIVDGGGNGVPTVVLPGGSVAVASAAIGVAIPAGINVPFPSGPVTIVSTVLCFVRQGVAPVALADGTDMAIPPNILIHTYVVQGNKLSFNSIAAGSVYIYQGT